MYLIHRIALNAVFIIFLVGLISIIPQKSFSATVTIDMVPPVTGEAHLADGNLVTPSTILGNPLSTDQDFSNLMDNSFNTFYQPIQESTFPLIGRDVLLDFEFPPIPDNAIIEQVTLRVGISPTDTDGVLLRGYGFAPYNRNDFNSYLNIDIGPGILGIFPVSPLSPDINLPPFQLVRVPLGTSGEMNLSPEELTLDNVRNLSVALIGVNDDRTIFDRVSLVNATVVYSVPDPLTVLLDPPTATNEIFTDPEHTVTATVERMGVPEGGVLVEFEIVSGPNRGEVSDPNTGECVPDDCTTDENGQVSWTYSTNEDTGTDVIVATVFDEQTVEFVESNTVEKIWIVPPKDVPTISQWGLIVLAGILGLAGFIYLRRREMVT